MSLLSRPGRATRSVAGRWWEGLDKPGWRTFAWAMGALGVALALALYSAAAAEKGQIYVAGGTALTALGLSGWVAVKFVPALARRTPLRWLAYRINYKLTREGVVYLVGVFVIILAALNTGNNLLFMILASMLAGIIMSGILSSVVLTGVEMKLELPEHIFATQPVIASLALTNEKYSLPSFSLRVAGPEVGKTSRKQGKKEFAQRRKERKDEPASEGQILTRPVYFPYLPKRGTVEQQVELTFPRRGVHRQDLFTISTKFPFGFLQKMRRVETPMEVVVYPRVEPTEEFYEILPLLSGEIESFYRGRGHDLYSVRDYQPSDSARFVHWKASARTSTLKVREFTREDERRVMLVLDPFLAAPEHGSARAEALEKFERAVTLCACLAWHFHEIDSELQFRTPVFDTPMVPAGEIIYAVLRELSFIEACPGGDGAFLSHLAEEADTFKIILTSQQRGSIPTSLWSSSYLIFIQAL
jgi:uncharacterized protein (DUF58 family)